MRRRKQLTTDHGAVRVTRTRGSETATARCRHCLDNGRHRGIARFERGQQANLHAYVEAHETHGDYA